LVGGPTSVSQASPMPSSSASDWSAFGVSGQLSPASATPALSLMPVV